MRLRLLVLPALLLCACVTPRVVRPAAFTGPLPQRVAFTGYRLYVRDFTLAGGGDDGKLNDLRAPFAEAVMRHAQFDAVSPDPPAVGTEEGKRLPGDLSLDVEVDASHSVHRTWALDVLDILCLGLFPVVPQWGETVVLLQAHLYDAAGQLRWNGTSVARGSWTMLIYPWFRTGPTEESYSETYAEAFTQLARAVAEHRADIVGSPAPATDRP